MGAARLTHERPSGYLCLGSPGVDDHDGYGRHPEQVVGNAPEDHVRDLAAATVANHEELGLEAFRHSRQLRRDHVRLLQDQPRRHSMGPGGLGCLSQDRVGLLDALLGGAVLWGVPVQTFRRTRKCTRATSAPRPTASLSPSSAAWREAGDPSTPITMCFISLNGSNGLTCRAPARRIGRDALQRPDKPVI